MNRTEPEWKTLKAQGRSHYQDENYAQALQAYQDALASLNSIKNNSISNPSFGGLRGADSTECQLLLSNSVACRLKLGGQEMALKAVEEAKQCITLNDQWAKAYIRLASAYIALGNHSNDVCNALQTALRLDPSYSLARQMLVRELRRDIPSSSKEDATTGRQQDRTNHDTERFHVNGVGPSAPPPDGVEPSAPPLDDDDNNNGTAPNTIPDDRDHMPPIPDLPENDDDYTMDIDDDFTWMERMQQFKSRIVAKYQHLPDDYKAICQVLGVLLILYIAFGGRFGMGSIALPSSSPRGTNRYDYTDTTTRTTRGNYGEGNAYDEYYRRKKQGRSTYSYSSGSNSRNYDDDYGYSYDSTSNRQYRPRRQRQSSTFNLGNDSMAVIMIAFATLLVLQYAGLLSIQMVHDLLWILGGLGVRRRGFRGGAFGGNGGFGHGGLGRRRGGFRFGNMRF